MNLPSPIQAYFDADRSSDGEALIRAFAPDAVVEDEGRTYVGRQAISRVVERNEGEVSDRHRAAGDKRRGRCHQVSAK